MTAPHPGPAPLHASSVGVAGPRVAFLHGLFGRGRNWTRVAKAVAGPGGTDARCALVDLPDHGRSPWSQEFSYESYAQQVVTTLGALAPGERWILVGHSLGGKVAMMVALRHRDVVRSLAIVDIAPKDYGDLERFRGYLEAMQALPLGELTTRADAERRFAAAVPDPALRGFLLQNLRRHGATWSWQVNLGLIAADTARGNASAIAGFPVGRARAWDGPAVLVAGSESPYIGAGDIGAMRMLFPRTRLVTVKGAGHWVHADAPGVVSETVRRVVDAAD